MENRQNGVPLAVYFSSGSFPSRPIRITLFTDFAIWLLYALVPYRAGVFGRGAGCNSLSFVCAVVASIVPGYFFTTSFKVLFACCGFVTAWARPFFKRAALVVSFSGYFCKTKSNSAIAASYFFCACKAS